MRKAKPFLGILVLECFAQNASKAHKITVNQLEQFLIQKANYSKREATDAVCNLLDDKIIAIVLDNKKTSRSLGSQSIRLCSNEEIEVSDHDWYCFECFEPGELVKCIRCTRAFHSACIRKNPERPNYAMPATNQIDCYDDEYDVNSMSNNILTQSRTTTPVESVETVSSVQTSSAPLIENRNVTTSQVRPCHVVLIDFMRSLENAGEFFKTEIDEQLCLEQKLECPDVVCMGEVRPPTRQRLNISVTPNLLKYESKTLGDGIEGSVHLCTCCRLLKRGQLTQPPNLSPDEMHHLINYGFKRSRAWIKSDINKNLENLKLPEKSTSILFKKLFQRTPIKTLDTIDKNIKNVKYTLLVEVLVDFFEWHFAFGVLFGKNDLRFDCSKYAVRDISYDIAELKRCPDCYRHSNKRVTPFWFALPCLQRHELVFAKCPGHSFWPAKVVRVLRNAAKYDVRFFGGNHERSLIDSCNIRPIDTMNIPFPKLLSFKKAMDELRCYQAFMHFSPTQFSFHANQDEVAGIIKNIVGAITCDYENRTNSSKRRKPYKNKTLNNQTLTSENEADTEACSSSRSVQSIKQGSVEKRRGRPPTLLRLENCSGANSPISTSSTPTSLATLTNNYSYSTITIEQHIAELNALREQLYEIHQRELIIAKRMPYCIKCLQPAKLLCCIHAWYCSKTCQRVHWYEGHDKQCDNSTSTNGC